MPLDDGWQSLEELPPFRTTVSFDATRRIKIERSFRGKQFDETLFQLPRTDSFLRAFAKMAYVADQTLHDLLEDMERLARERKAVTKPAA